jgi:hypothetical protein
MSTTHAKRSSYAFTRPCSLANIPRTSGAPDPALARIASSDNIDSKSSSPSASARAGASPPTASCSAADDGAPPGGMVDHRKNRQAAAHFFFRGLSASD